jgi:cytochrome c-type biogenesis protein CcmE
MTRKQKRLAGIGGMVGVVALAVGLVLQSLSTSIAFFNSPTDIVSNAPAPTQRIRLGGLVEQGSVQRGADSKVRFRVTDSVQTVPVVYAGLLPDLFREGQGIVAQGAFLPDRSFRATQVLAKHDETYMPREVADRLKAKGEWRPETGADPT